MEFGKTALRGRSRPLVARCRAVAAVPKPAPNAPQVPRLKGGLPWLGVMGKYDIMTLYDTVQNAMVADKARVMEIEVMGMKSVYCRHPEDCAAILKDQKRFVKSEKALSRLSGWLGNGLASNTNLANHAAVKEILMPAFKSASIKGFVPAFAQSAGELADMLEAAAGKPINVEPLCRRATLDVIGRTGFGYEFSALKTAALAAAGQADAEQVDLIEMYDGILAGAMWLVFDLPIPENLLPSVDRYRRGVKAVDSIIDKMVKERRANGIPAEATDLLAFMLRAQEGGSEVMTDRQLRDELQTMILAGSDTTATTLAFALGELARNPGVAAAAAAEVKAALGGADPASVPAEVYQSRLPLVTGIANETLRLYPAVTETGRTCLQDEQFGDYRLPAGSVVLPSVYSLQRHEDYWPRPNEWLPERWLPANAPTMAPHADKAFMPFTVGPRSCIGRFFAQLELQVLLAVLLQRLDFESAPGHEIATRVNFTLASRDGIHVIPHAKQQADV